MAIAAAVGLIWRIKLARCCCGGGADRRLVHVPGTGTGSIWGKPMWGTWWVWDARSLRTDLLFLYLGYMACARPSTTAAADRASAVLAIVGVINVPIIHYSVEWWTTLTSRRASPRSTSLDRDRDALPLFIMIIGFQLYFGWRSRDDCGARSFAVSATRRGEGGQVGHGLE